MRLYTIGFTKSSAQHFFERLREAGVRRLLDVRLHNSSQLAGFAKRGDLAYFARELAGVDYVPVPELAPTPDMLKRYRGVRDWGSYAQAYGALIETRRVEETLDKSLADGGCLLCSEAKPHHCHRRLAAEYLQDRWPGLEVVHL